VNPMSKQATALIMAGGTGGHIFPGLAVAHALQARGWHTTWLGAKGGMEESLVGKESINLNLISVAGLRGKGILGWLKAPISLTQAVVEAVKVLRRVKPEVVVGFGGFASGPGGLAAFLTRTPLVIHEQNAIAGMTNKVLAKMAKKVFQAFPGAFKHSQKVETVGNPLRSDIERLNAVAKDDLSKERRVNVLVVGGSRGALALNKNVPLILKDLINNEKVSVRHQVGSGRHEETRTFYSQAGLDLTADIQLSEFIDDMADAFLWADLIICRAGASTVSEIAAAGICAVFVPFPYAVDDHQTANASWLVKEDAALCINEKRLTEKHVVEQVAALVESPEKINRMAKKARQIAYLNAADKVADYCDAFRKQAA